MKICCFYKDILFQYRLCFPPFAQSVRGWEGKGIQSKQELSVFHIHNTCWEVPHCNETWSLRILLCQGRIRRDYPRTKSKSVISQNRNQVFKDVFLTQRREKVWMNLKNSASHFSCGLLNHFLMLGQDGIGYVGMRPVFRQNFYFLHFPFHSRFTSPAFSLIK